MSKKGMYPSLPFFAFTRIAPSLKFDVGSGPYTANDLVWSYERHGLGKTYAWNIMLFLSTI